MVWGRWLSSHWRDCISYRYVQEAVLSRYSASLIRLLQVVHLLIRSTQEHSLTKDIISNGEVTRNKHGVIADLYWPSEETAAGLMELISQALCLLCLLRLRHLGVKTIPSHEDHISVRAKRDQTSCSIIICHWATLINPKEPCHPHTSNSSLMIFPPEPSDILHISFDAVLFLFSTLSPALLSWSSSGSPRGCQRWQPALSRSQPKLKTRRKMIPRPRKRSVQLRHRQIKKKKNCAFCLHVDRPDGSDWTSHTAAWNTEYWIQESEELTSMCCR